MAIRKLKYFKAKNHPFLLVRMFKYSRENFIKSRKKMIKLLW